MNIYCEGCNSNKFEVYMRKDHTLIKCSNKKCDKAEELILQATGE